MSEFGTFFPLNRSFHLFQDEAAGGPIPQPGAQAGFLLHSSKNLKMSEWELVFSTTVINLKPFCF